MKVEWTFQYVPPTICHHFLRIGLRGFLLWVKMPRKQTGHCFQNAPKVPFSLRKGFKTNIFTGWWKICCQVGSRWIKEEVLISREAIWFFSPGFELGAAADKKQTESCEEGGEDSLFTTSDMFSHKGKLSKQVTFSTSEKLFWPICCNISSASDAGGKVV